MHRNNDNGNEIANGVPCDDFAENQSFSSDIFPYDLKTAILKPLLKKLGPDPENFKNLRSISNIAFLSKLLESLACEQ